ncbi:hypothetical protein [Caproicibacter fermentans]|uniref:hypothetical protein n=1 Tax=Caproicibacter fermentans TaxID=2576756 RepID=UPI0012ED0453|nr:hypothetical protein [Caproicibacter fermentans]
MRKDNVEQEYRKTKGAPFALGMASCLLFLLSAACVVPVASYFLGMLSVSPENAASWYRGLAAECLLNPGIFMLILFLGRRWEKRGRTVAEFWAAAGGFFMLSVLIHDGSLTWFFVPGRSAPVYGSYRAAVLLRFAGGALMTAACAVYLARLKKHGY